MAESARHRRLRAPSFGIGEVIGDTFSIWIRNILPFFVLTALIYAPLVVYSIAVLTGEPTAAELRTYTLVQRFGGFLLGLVVTGAVSFAVFRQLGGNPASVGESIRVGLRSLLPVLAVGILEGLALIACFIPFFVLVATLRPVDFTLPVFLFLASFLPFLVVYCMLFVAVPAAVVERPGIRAALRRSVVLTNKAKLGIFGALFVIVLFQGMVGMVIGLALSQSDALPWVTLVVGLVLGPMQPVAAASAYYRLRVAKEGIGVEELIRVFA
ncbi:MAG: hypothetical protein ACYSX0_14395 [Planctomycetota bacterium]|jgi:hypothetical protein